MHTVYAAVPGYVTRFKALQTSYKAGITSYNIGYNQLLFVETSEKPALQLEETRLSFRLTARFSDLGNQCKPVTVHRFGYRRGYKQKKPVLGLKAVGSNWYNLIWL
jgi:hypothetical protein